MLHFEFSRVVEAAAGGSGYSCYVPQACYVYNLLFGDWKPQTFRWVNHSAARMIGTFSRERERCCSLILRENTVLGICEAEK